ncbi:GTP-binding protein [Actinopolymorpha singaporensis]|uniref:elongation factor G n=1 Tax=Actinopolymorpha singaporensis TaxID=117157 RepID=UPI000B849A28|nr:TetM/TetW/TetO/TetS family tetracycline resistance ribosomal protection protein [Actinopolymorpha singaporensis]
MRTLNLGIVAHVDAGKTSLTERLLHLAGVIARVGSVDAGDTQTDSLELERRRGITIRSAVVSFVLDGVSVNLIDTPGHPDFVAEVERVLGVLDGAVLVVSAVEGVQAQTRVLMRTLRRLGIPVLVFVNKVDRGGADTGRVFGEIGERLTPAVVAMGRVLGEGTGGAGFVAYGPEDEAFVAGACEVLADVDEEFLAAWVDGGAEVVTGGRVRRELVCRVAEGRVYPVFFGSAITGAGVAELVDGIIGLLPAVEGEVDAPAAGTVFKVERGPAGEKVAYLRMFAGELRVRERVRFGGGDGGGEGEKVTAIGVFEQGAVVTRPSVTAGRIAKVWGLSGVRIGDRLGEPGTGVGQQYFAPPTLETVVVPVRVGDKGRLHVALTQLAEQDPLINLRQDDVRGELYVSLYGEVQKEVVEATLALEYGIDVTFRETTPICVERVLGSGSAVEVLGRNENPFLSTVGLRVDPAPVGSGVRVELDVKLELIPLYVFKSVEEFRQALRNTIVETLQQGLHGWQVTDCVVTLTDSGYVSPETGAGDVRKLTPLVLMSALRQAGTVVCEPVHRFRLEFPADTLGAVLPLLGRLRGVPGAPLVRGSSGVLEGDIPAAMVHELQQHLPGVTHGEGVLESAFDHHEPVRGAFPTRPRTDLNPLNRKEYLQHVLRGV